MENSSKNSTTMLLWMISVVCFIGGGILIPSNPIFGISIIEAGLFTFPPMWHVIKKIWPYEIPVLMKIIVFGVCIGTGIFFGNKMSDNHNSPLVLGQQTNNFSKNQLKNTAAENMQPTIPPITAQPTPLPIDNWVQTSASPSCITPIQYGIDSIDSGFSISQKELADDMSQAADIWNTAAQKQLFVYNPSGKLRIRMIFDNRQQLLNSVNQQETQLASDRQNLGQENAQFKEQTNALQQQTDSLRSEINSWNNNGGAPASVAGSLNDQKAAIQQQANDLSKFEAKIKSDIAASGTKVDALNQAMKQFNDSLQPNPYAGEYDAANDTVKLFLYYNQNKLIHLIAHEFGHVLGLGHSTSPNSLMYATSDSQVLTPSTEDIQTLKQMCTL